MKILHINCNYMDSWLHQNMIEQLSELKVENQVFVPVYDSTGHSVVPKAYVKACECFKKRDRIIYQYKQAKILKCVQNEYNISDFDCIHAYTVFTDGNIARKLHKKYGIPYVVAVRNTDINNFFKYMLHLRKVGIGVLRDAFAIFFLSPAYKGELFDKYIPMCYRKELLGKSYIIPNGIDKFWICNEKNEINDRLKHICRKEVRFIFVGNIDKNKNVLFVAEAINKLIFEGWKVQFDVVGKVKDYAQYKKLVLYDFVHYYEPMDKEKLMHMYRNNDIFVMTSHTESFGLVYAEALSQGLPVIYTKGQGFDKQFPDGFIGYAASDTDIVDLLEKIKKILSNYETIVKNIRGAALKFSWKEICDEYKKIYLNIK